MFPNPLWDERDGLHRVLSGKSHLSATLPLLTGGGASRSLEHTTRGVRLWPYNVTWWAMIRLLIFLESGRCWLWDTRNPSNTSCSIWVFAKQGRKVKITYGVSESYSRRSTGPLPFPSPTPISISSDFRCWRCRALPEDSLVVGVTGSEALCQLAGRPVNILPFPGLKGFLLSQTLAFSKNICY